MQNEIVRQLVHICVVGTYAAVAFLFSQQVALVLLFSALVGGLAIIWQGSSHVLSALERFDRSHVKIPAKGAIMATIGSFLTLLLFPAQAPYAILILAFADSLATVVGLRFPSVRLHPKSNKTVAGTLTFFLVSMFILGFSLKAFIISLVATLVEVGDYHKLRFVDDNLLIPLVAGMLLLLL